MLRQKAGCERPGPHPSSYFKGRGRGWGLPMTTMKKYTLLLLLTGLFAACTTNFEEINTDPNRPKEINPGVMLGQLQYRIVNSATGHPVGLRTN